MSGQLVVNNRIHSVEILRGLASLSVACFHFTLGLNLVWLTDLAEYGRHGVDVFFVLSGFVIPLAISRAFPHFGLKNFPAFLARRLLRLEPPYLASVVLVVAVWELASFASGYAAGRPDWNFPQLMFHIAYAIPLTSYAWLQPVYWTLAYEFAFYIFAGVFYWAYAGSSWAAWFALSCVVFALCGVKALDPLCILFLMGIAVFRRLSIFDSMERTLAVLAISVLTLAIVNREMEAVVGLATALVLMLTYRTRLLSPAWKPLFFLGKVSYSFYLVHGIIGGHVMRQLSKLLPTGQGSELLAVFAALSASLILAFLFYRLIERPAIEASRMILSPTLSQRGAREP